MDFALTEQQELIRKEVSSLARSFPPEYWLEKDGKAEYPWEFVKAFAQAGWLGAIIPEEYGGSGLGVTEAALMLHDIAASGAGTSGCSPIHFYCFPPMPVMKHGTELLAEISAAHRHRRDRHGLRRDRAQRRNGHLAHPDARRALR
jgi:alkylation response protein AidB-like acyl-CoA dehydrogenase